jgi:hypothetical protein
LPILNSSENEEIKNLISEFSLGINYEAGNVSELTEAILCIANQPELRLKLAKATRGFAEQKLDRLNRYIDLLKLFA